MKIADLFVKLGLNKDNFDKGIDGAKEKVSSFGTSLGNFGSKLSSLLGLDPIISKVKETTNQVTSLFTGLKASTASASIFSRAMNVIKVAMVSTGIGAIIVAFGTLITYFTRTERGAEKIERVMAGVRAVFDVLMDRVAAFGEGLFMIMTGEFKAGAGKIKESLKGIVTEMKAESKQAVQLERDLQALEDREIALIESLAERRAKAAQLRLESKEEENAEKRKKMLVEAMALERSAFDDEISMAKERARIESEKVGMGESLDEDIRRRNQLNAEALKLEREASNTLRSYSRELKAVNNELDKIAEYRDKYKNEFKGEKLDILPTSDTPSQLTAAPVDSKTLGDMSHMLDAVSEKRKQWTADELQGWMEFSRALNETITNGIANAISSMAEGLGELASGEISGAEFGEKVLNVVGNFMKTLGGLFIAYGIANLKFMKALTAGPTPMGAGLAIAAGVGLIAAGAAVSNFAKKGVSSGGAASAASGYSNYTQSNAAQALVGNVVFELEGTKLKGVLNNTDRRNGLIR